MEQTTNALDLSLLVWPGAALALAGVVGILACVRSVMKARNAGLPDAEMVAHMQKMGAWNMAALGVSAIGLALVVIGLLLG
ncbi:hypothetical protein [Vannielia litorea]|uniref:hypothetical protein n=1 Tax=Vannielia litorea TaxID=1217970 RepID=UPI001C9606BE|nr:hypothetical protein [Vannielia litorea]MBY6046688.1 hypothetical protein [Vannielia litorea]MBY6074102.1 hypothetical protein [Vannielia litorea]